VFSPAAMAGEAGKGNKKRVKASTKINNVAGGILNTSAFYSTMKDVSSVLKRILSLSL
jgi:hypothetical protein